ncbi:MAG: FkbM family methyltransferase [Pirellulales bacterium]
MSGRLRYLYRAYRYRFRVDPAEMRFMRDRLRPGDLAVDVGCFKGAYTYWMQRWVGAAGRVVAFEPQPEQVAYIRRAIAQMKWHNVSVEGQGVSNVAGQLELLRPPSGHEATFVLRKATEQPCERILVPVTTLDAKFAAASAGPAFIKIDVEGHELEVLEGARETVSAHRPTLLIECETRHRPDGDVRPVFNFLASLGYEGSFFHGRNRRPLAEFDAAVYQRIEPDGTLPVGYSNNFAFEHPARRRK